LKTVTKFILANSLIAILTISSFALFSLSRLHEEEGKEANDDLERCMRTSWAFLWEKGEEFRIVDGKLLVGNYVINGNFEVPDKVQNIFGGVATVFLGDTRVSTNVLKADGSRAIGTRLEGPAYDAIFKEGKSYRGEAPILGIPYLTAYDPIRDGTGKIIGVNFVGVKKGEVLKHFSALRMQLTLTLFVLMTVFVIFMTLLVRMARKSEKTNESHLTFLQTLIDTIPNPIFYKNPEGKYLGGNKAFEEMTGLSRERFTGKSVQDIAPQHLVEIYHNADLELFRKQGVQIYESPVAYADGTLRDVIFYKATFTADGTLGGIVGTILDISDRKRAESALAAQKEFAENLVQNSTVPTFVLDSRHRVISWNLACEGVTGVKAMDVLGTDEHWKAFYDHERPLLADFAIDGSPQNVLDYYSSFSKSNVIPEGIQAEGWFPEMNGCDRFLLFSAAPIRDNRGELVAAIETFEEITGRRRAEEKIQQTLSMLRATLEATADGILVTDLDGKIVAYNRQFAEMWQIPESILDTEVEQQVLLLALGQLKHPDEYAAQVREHYDRPEAENRYTFEFIDGRVVERYSKPQRVGDKVVGRVRSFRDITEQRKLEAQLRHSQKMEAIGTLAGGIAHDFNNILTAIIGYGHLLEMKLGTDDPLRLFVTHILTAADRAANLTKSLLAFGRKQNIEPLVVDLSGIVQGVEKFLLKLLREDIELQTTIADEACMVFADSGQIEQILMNLATNAHDAMPNGGKLAITTAMISLDRDFVATHGYGAPGRFALLTVTDTGAGMDAETKSRIFEPFFTTKEVGKGTGLGLSMAYGIVKQHNGFINCYSEPGNGTTFRIYLPTVDALAEPVPVPSSKTPQGGTETILVAEDDEQVRMLTHKLLESFGYTVIEARDGNDALTQFFAHQENIQLALLDVIMPGKNGRDAYEEMRKKSPGLKVLFTSGYSADIFQRGKLDESNIAFISKPVLPAELLQKIRQLLDD